MLIYLIYLYDIYEGMITEHSKKLLAYQRLSQVEAPVLLLAGELDHPEVLRRNEFLLREIPDAREQLIPHAGHNAPLENPTGFMDGIEQFLERLRQD